MKHNEKDKGSYNVLKAQHDLTSSGDTGRVLLVVLDVVLVVLVAVVEV